MSKIFSPSQTKNYLECPYAWLLNRRGWIPKIYGKPNTYALRGGAVSVGLELFNREQTWREALEQYAHDEYYRMRLDVRQWSDLKSPEPTLEDLTQQALAIVQAYVSNPPGTFSVVEPEYKFPNHGFCRPDVIGVSRGVLQPIDYKTKDTPATPFYRNAIIRDYRNDWAQTHYCWAIGEEFQQACLTYIICILWYDKVVRVECFPYSITPERMENWLRSATEVWARMEAIENGDAQPYEVANHRTQFGACVFQKACLDYNRDESLMEQHYIKREGK